MQPAINGGRAPTLYHPLWLHQGVVDARGAVTVIFTGVHWVHLGPNTYLSEKADETVQTLSRAEIKPSIKLGLNASPHISGSGFQSCADHVNPSIQYDVISTPSPDL